MILEPIRASESNQDSPLFNVTLPNSSVELKADGSGIDKKHEGIELMPTPGFVLKTHSRENLKVFINICYHDLIDKQSTKKRLDQNGKEVEGLNLPLSMGPIRFCNDKNGKSSLVVDAILNTSTRDDISEDNTGCHRDFVCQLLMDCFEQKYKDYAYLDRKYKLPSMTYMGYIDTRNGAIIRQRNEFAEVCKQMVKNTKNIPKIEEISSKPTQKLIQDFAKPDFSFAIVLSNKQVMDIDDYVNECNTKSELFKIPKWDRRLPLCYSWHEMNDIPTAIIATAVIEYDNIKLISIQISSFLIQIRLETQKYEIVLPLCINTHDMKSIYDEATSTLKMILSVNQISIEDSPDPGTQQWLFAQGISKEGVKKVDGPHSKHPSTNVLDENNDDPYHLQPMYTLNKPRQIIKSELKDAILPEDEFHSKDYISQYHKQQQEQERLETIREKSSNDEKHSDEYNSEQSVPETESNYEEFSCMTDEDYEHAKILKEAEELILKSDGSHIFENDLWYRLL